MAGKTLTELVRELQQELTTLRGELAAVEQRVGEADLPGVRERLAVVERLVADLTRREDEYERRGSRLAVLESQLAELQKRFEEAERRRWQMTVLFIGSVPTLAVQVAILFVKK